MARYEMDYHSRLLKYIVPHSRLFKMTEESKYKFEYKNPNNIESEVPGEQQIREATDVTADATETNEDQSNFTYVPVMTVTKEETALTKGDMKLQKVLVTEEIAEDPDSKVGMITIINPLFSEVLGQVLPGPHKMRENDNNNGEKRNGEAKIIADTKEDKKSKAKSRLPVSKFKYAVNKVTEENKKNVVKPDKSEVTSAVVRRRTSIPRLKKDKRPEKSETTETIQRKNNQTEPEDEFDKIYDEIADKDRPQSIVDIVSPIDDPVKLENKFEEIVHDYEENNIQPVNVDKLKLSKIPLLKRRSDHDIDVPKHLRKTSLSKNTLCDDHNTKNSIIKSSEVETDVKISIGRHEIQEATLSSPIRTPKESSPRKLNEEMLNNDPKREIIVPPYDSMENNAKDLNSETVEKGQQENETEEKIDNLELNKCIEETETTQTKEPYTRLDSKPNIPLPTFKENNNEFYDTKTDIVTKKINRENSIQDKKDDSFENIVNTKDEPSLLPLRERFKIMAEKYKDNSEVKSIPNVQVTKKEYEKPNVSNNNPHRFITNLNKTENKSLNYSINKTESKKPNSSSVSDKGIKLKDVETIALETDKVNEKHTSDSLTEDASNKVENAMVQDNLISESNEIVTVDNIAIEEKKEENKDSITTVIEHQNKNDKNHEMSVKENQEQTDVEIMTSKILSNENDNVEDPPILKGKVNRLISRLHSVEPQPEIKKDIKEDLPKRKSISSKIAMFERLEPNETYSKKGPTIKDNFIEKPKIVHEVLKSQPERKKSETNDTKQITEILEPKSLNKIAINEEKNQSTFVEQVVLPETLKEEAVLYEKIDIKEIGRKFDGNNVNNLLEDKKPHVIENNITNEIVGKSLDNSTLNGTIRNNEIKGETEPYKPISDEVINNQVRNKDIYETTSRRDKNDVFTTAKSNTYDPKFEEPDDSNLRRVKSSAELDLGDAVKGKVKEMIVRIKSMEQLDIVDKKEVINIKERPVKMSVLEKIALFEKISATSQTDFRRDFRIRSQSKLQMTTLSEGQYQERIKGLMNAKVTYGSIDEMKYVKLRSFMKMPILILGTALVDNRLLFHIVSAAIDLGYRAIDCAYIYGNEKLVGEAIKAKIDDGTVKREDLFIINKLWSTYHRPDLVEEACRRSLETMGLEYFDLYLIHNPMSFKEGSDPIPKIGDVVQYSDYDFLDAWGAIEKIVAKDLVRSIGVSNFNPSQLTKVLHKAKIPCVVNQVEHHPYLTQRYLHDYCEFNSITMTCYGVLGSKGTPKDLKTDLPPVIDDRIVNLIAAAVNMTPAQLLIRYQIECGHTVVVKASSAERLWENLQALSKPLKAAKVRALHRLNRNQRTFTFKGMGDTHKNYPFTE